MKKKIVCLLLAILILSTLAGCSCQHEWQDATCTAPKTCQSCGATEGNTTDHSWKDATCIAPKTCQSCGATEGDTTDHSWKDATCIAPKTCQSCDATEGNTTDHSWKDATCSAPKTCQTCGATEGSAVDHIRGAWVIESEASYSLPGVQKAYCIHCGELLAEEEFFKERIQNGVFVFSRQELMDMLKEALSEYSSDFTVRDDSEYLVVGDLGVGKLDYLLYFLVDNKTVGRKLNDPLNVDSLLVVFTRKSHQAVHISTLIECCYPEIDATTLEDTVIQIQDGNELILGNLSFCTVTVEDNSGDYEGLLIEIQG